MQIGMSDYGRQEAKRERAANMTEEVEFRTELTPEETEKLGIAEATQGNPVPKTILKSDNPSTAEIINIYDRETGALETVPASPQEIPVPNEYALGAQMGIIRPTFYPQHGTKQSCYRYAAWLLTLAETLPDEAIGAYSWEEIREAHKRETGQSH